MAEESTLKGREELRMKQKRGVIPRRMWNALVDVVFANSVASVVGGKLSRTRNGTVIEVPRRPLVPYTDRLPFEPYQPKYGSYWTVKVWPGWVVEIEPKNSGQIHHYHMPTIGGVDLNAATPPELSIAALDFCYCKIVTDDRGLVTGATIEVSSDDKEGVHYIPPAPGETSGTAGEMWKKLFLFDIADGAPVITVYQQSDIEWCPYVWTGEHVGDLDGRIYKGYNGTTKEHEFRSIVGAGDASVSTVGDNVLITVCTS